VPVPSAGADVTTAQATTAQAQSNGAMAAHGGSANDSSHVGLSKTGAPWPSQHIVYLGLP
jgi:hypothetical protein